MTAKAVEPGSLALPGAPLCSRSSAKAAYRLEASVEESRLAAIRVGQAVSVTLDSVDRTMDARVSEIVPAVDAASRAYIVKIDLPAIAVAALRDVRARGRSSLGSRTAAGDSGGARSRSAASCNRSWWPRTASRARGWSRLGRSMQGSDRSALRPQRGRKVIFPVPPGLADGARVEVRP